MKQNAIKRIKTENAVQPDWTPSQKDIDWRYMKKAEFIAKYPEEIPYWRTFCHCGFNRRSRSEETARQFANEHAKEMIGHLPKFREYESYHEPPAQELFGW